MMPHPWEKEWKVVKPLGKGGQGITRLVSSASCPERIGVLKYLLNNRSSSARARMRREVANLQSLSPMGAKVPQVLDHNTDEFLDATQELYLVMEFIPGPTLKELVEQSGKLTIENSIAITLELCQTIAVAHTEGILHRDIKPDNIIIPQEKMSAYIVDYGLSFNTLDEDVTETLETFRNKFLDLPETNSPGGDRRDPRSDITAVCACFYYMLTGHRPGQLQDSAGKPPHLRAGFTIRDSIAADHRTPQIEMILNRGLAVPIQNRFQSIDEFVQRLEILQNTSTSTVSPDPITTAKELSVQIRLQDRKTQIAEFQPIGNQLLQEFASSVNKSYAKLDRFRCRIDAGGQNVPMLSGLDEVCGPYSLSVSVEHHKSRRLRIYKIASRGEQCVVCVCDFAPSADGSKSSALGWKEIAWYEGKASGTLKALLDDFCIWLDESLKSIAQDVIS